MAKATARHILVPTQEECENIKKQIEGGADFAELAGKHSQCPSGKQGGDLGEFSAGQMVKEFDQVIFNDELGKVQGPVPTHFGFHHIAIMSRNE